MNGDISEISRSRIVHVVRQFHPGVGGLENFVDQLARRQADAGHKVRVATLNHVFDHENGATLPPREERHGFEIVRFAFIGSRRYPVAPSVLKATRGADLVHVHGLDFFADYLAATAPWHRTPLVLSTHGGFFHTDFARNLKKVYLASVSRASLSQFGAVIACSTED